MSNSKDNEDYIRLEKESDYIPSGAIHPDELKVPNLENISLDFKDYVAIVIAALQTVMVPTFAFIVLIIVLSAVITFLFG